MSFNRRKNVFGKNNPKLNICLSEFNLSSCNVRWHKSAVVILRVDCVHSSNCRLAGACACMRVLKEYLCLRLHADVRPRLRARVASGEAKFSRRCRSPPHCAVPSVPSEAPPPSPSLLTLGVRSTLQGTCKHTHTGNEGNEP